ncbi:hypothetical protein ScPMuIL_008846 [Solemya velum]
MGEAAYCDVPPKKIRRHLPPGTGNYSVGCVDIMCDHTVNGSFFRLFYPIEKTDVYKRDRQWPKWCPRKQYGHGYAYYLGTSKKVFGKILNWMGGDVYVPALWQGPLDFNQNRFPVVVFSHGVGGNRTTYTTICCELASHGFVVAAIEHRDGTASLTYHLKEKFQRQVSLLADHDEHSRHQYYTHHAHGYQEQWKWFERPNEEIPWDDYTYRNKQVHGRADDCIRVLEVIAAMDAGKEVRNSLGLNFNMKQFKNRLDLSKAALVGHSFGGSTCVCALSKDNRFKVGVSLDGWMHPIDEAIYRDIWQPLLMVNMETFQWKKNIVQMQRLQDKEVERTMITIKGTCHQSVTDFQFLLKKPLARIMGIRYTLSPRIAIAMNNKAILGFLNKHLDIPCSDTHEDILTGKHRFVISGTNVDLS